MKTTEHSRTLAGATGSAIGDELFELVQGPQGYAYISDMMGDWSRHRVVNVAKASLYHTQETAKILRRFIKKHSLPNADSPTASRIFKK
jgi:hypothetical protein